MARAARATAQPAFSISAWTVTPRSAEAWSRTAASSGVRIGSIRSPGPADGSRSNRHAEGRCHPALVTQRDHDVAHAERTGPLSRRALHDQAGRSRGRSGHTDVVPPHVLDAPERLSARLPGSPSGCVALRTIPLPLAVRDLLRGEDARDESLSPLEELLDPRHLHQIHADPEYLQRNSP